MDLIRKQLEKDLEYSVAKLKHKNEQIEALKYHLEDAQRQRDEIVEYMNQLEVAIGKLR